MGLDIEREHFSPEDFARFRRRLQESLTALEALVARPGFGAGPLSLGAELELDLVDAQFRPAGVNRAVLAESVDDRLTLEVDRFNLEVNLRPCGVEATCLDSVAAQLNEALTEVRRAAALHGAQPIAVGILPTIAPSDLGPDAITDQRRYQALQRGIARARRSPFPFRIEGEDLLEGHSDDVSVEGANTSFQLHLRVHPDAFARTYNAAQLATGVALAACGNSPFFLGRRLWDETRIALFRQSVDDRPHIEEDDWHPARVSFGHGWVRTSAVELFAECVAQHEPLLPALSEESPLEVVKQGGVPTLAELRLHMGTVWRWNRAVYDANDGGHLRIEYRALPSGPSVPDMVANTAFLVGLTLALAPRADELVRSITFGQARRNFYQSARFGLDAKLLWPSEEAPSPRMESAAVLLDRLVPLAEAGLVQSGVDSKVAKRWLSIFSARVASGQTGAQWQRRALERLRPGRTARDAMAEVVRHYLAAQISGKPVHGWPLP